MDTVDEGTAEPVGNDIAIIGMAGRLPGAPDLEAFWNNLRDGVESISWFTAEELESSPFFPPEMRSQPGFVPAGGFIAGAEQMDYEFFKLSPREAQWMDPQHRIFLECAWSALEDAAYDPGSFPGTIALYAGAGSSSHMLSLLGHIGKDPAALLDALGTATAESLAMRISYKLKLRGESVNVHTACSTGLVTVHMACQSLLLGQSDIALAGAVRLSMPQRTGYVCQEGMIFSPDGHCRAFDQSARGTVGGNGAAVVVLKRLGDALRDGDQIYAVIKGSAVNNDGDEKVGYTAPSVGGQAEVISQALIYAGVEAGDIGYVEAHGTGTSLGDPIEIAALTQAFRKTTAERGYCALGSVKTNIGHLDTVAGTAGLIKAALALHREEIPPSLHFERENPALDLEASPFRVTTSLKPWRRGPVKRRAGVSSFGIGGTNAHLILEEAPPRRATPSRRPLQIVTLSARIPSALDRMTLELADHLERHPDQELADVAFTRNVGRKAFEHRRAIVAEDRDNLIERLREPPAPARAPSGSAEGSPKAVFLFPGQGVELAGAARELYELEPDFREPLDAALDRLERIDPELRRAARDLLFAPREQGAGAEGRRRPPASEVALPSLLAVEYALARLWMRWGVEPHAVFGHSFGEYAAACLAGALSLEDALHLAAIRGQLMARMPPGAMLAVGLPEREVQALLASADRVSLAAVNGSSQCVISGPPEDIARLSSELARRAVVARTLATAHAFHSADVEPLTAELAAAAGGRARGELTRPYLSSRTGRWAGAEELRDPTYWARQMREPVRFADGLDALVAAGCTLFIEVGPDQTLTSLVKQHLRALDRGLIVPSLKRASSPRADQDVLLQGLGALWGAGVKVRWSSYYAHEERRRVALPPHPLERKDCALSPKWSSAILGAEVSAPAARAPEVAAPLAAAASASSAPTGAPVEIASAPPLDGAWSRREIERQITDVWRELLGVAEIKGADNFLEIGGNSLTMMQALNRLRDVFPVDLPLNDLFESPTLSGLAERLERRLLELGHAVREAPRAPPPSPAASAAPARPPEPARGDEAITRAPRTGELPLSAVQKRVLAMESVDPGNAAYNMPLALRLEGPLDLSLVPRCLDEIIRRHEALRTTYEEQDGRTLQIVRPPFALPLPVIDLRERGGDPEAQAIELARENALAPFAIDRAVIRATLLRVADADHRLLIAVHHVVSDTLSLLLMVQEFVSLYKASLAGAPSPLPELPVQYIDYAAWHERARRTEAFQRQEAYWRKQLANYPQPLPLPFDHAERPRARRRGGIRTFKLPERLTAAIHAFNQREGLTSFMTLLAAVDAVLARCTGQQDIVVGTPIGNRSRRELMPLVGYVAHSLALRTDLSGDPSFRQLAARVREVTVAAYEHPDIPFEALLDEVRPGLDNDRMPLFDAVLILHSAHQTSIVPDLPGVRLGLMDLPDAPAKFGVTLAYLTFVLVESEREFIGALEYNTGRFSPETIERLIERFQILLEAAVTQPERRVSALPLEKPAAPPPSEPTPPPPGATSGGGERRLIEAALAAPSAPRKSIDYSLSYFANDEDQLGGAKYKLLLEGAKYADKHGFSAIWTPERHFHPFGGLYPNPVVLSAAVATITERLRIRAGSMVMPLHDPIRVAEDWAIIDNLSNGRVDVSFASGWHVNDFVFAPDQYAERKKFMLQGIETVRRLWRGEVVLRRNGAGKEIEISIRPRPVQPELPIWITAAGNPETFRVAGEIGAGLLTNLMGQHLHELDERIALYRQAWASSGHKPGRGHVTLMLHTFLDRDPATARATARGPLLRYFRSTMDITSGFVQAAGIDIRDKVKNLTQEDIDRLLEYAFDRYVDTAGLIGTPESCAPIIERVRAADVDEVACLIDFGVDFDATMASLEWLATLLARPSAGGAALAGPPGRAAPIEERHVATPAPRPGAATGVAAPSEAATAGRRAEPRGAPAGRKGWSPLVPIHPSGSRRPLFCVAPIADFGLCYVALARHMGPDQPFYALQMRVLEYEEQERIRVEDIAAELIEAMRSVQPKGPYLLGGWSQGGYIALEMAHQLGRAGEEVPLVAILDAGADATLQQMPEDTLLLQIFCAVMGLTCTADDLNRRGPLEARGHVVDLARRARVVPSDFSEQQLDKIVSTYRAHLGAVHRYVKRPSACRLALFKATDRHDWNDEGRAYLAQHPDMGWGKLSSRPVAVHEVPGDHETLVQDPNVETLARQLTQCLIEVNGAQSH